MGKKLEKCKKCGKLVNVDFLHKDGICGRCKYYFTCKICDEETHYSRMKEEQICKKCYKNRKKNEKRFKLCPFCGEKIKYIAIKCRFCNEMLDKQADSGKISAPKNNSLQDKNVITDTKPQAIETKYNKLSIFSFISSFVSIFGFGLFGLIGLILGLVSLSQINKTTDKGKVFAITAIIIGFIWGIVVSILKRFVELGY